MYVARNNVCEVIVMNSKEMLLKFKAIKEQKFNKQKTQPKINRLKKRNVYRFNANLKINYNKKLKLN